MKVAIIGYGIDGKVSADYWRAKGDDVTICDRKADLEVPAGFQAQLGDDHLKNLDKFDIIVRTPGIRPSTILDANPDHQEIKERITTNLNEFLRACPSKKVIGITGTKGKGTTSTLVKKILEAAGFKTHLGGNIGIAALQMLPDIAPDDYVVLELSSFQLIDLTERVPTAACLMMAPEHLNWHTSLEEYFEAKAQLFKLQQAGDTAVYNARNDISRRIASAGPAKKIGYEVPPAGETPQVKEAAYVDDDFIYYQDEQIMPIQDVTIPGRHNLENVCAAITLAWPFLDGNIDAIKQGVTGFGGLAHHMENAGEVDGVKYINDSYSTMPDATIAALAATPGPKVLILGGGSKNLPLENMVNTVVHDSNIRHVILMGSLAEELRDMLEARGFKYYSFSQNGMADIVHEAQKYAQPGDTVLLSPGLPAKGDNYFIDNVDRGNQFKAILASLRD